MILPAENDPWMSHSECPWGKSKEEFTDRENRGEIGVSVTEVRLSKSSAEVDTETSDREHFCQNPRISETRGVNGLIIIRIAQGKSGKLRIQIFFLLQISVLLHLHHFTCCGQSVLIPHLQPHYTVIITH